MWKRILAIAILMAIIGGVYWFIRPYYRLPFDHITVFKAVPQNNAALLRLPKLRSDSSATAQLWYLDAKRLAESLSQLGLVQAVQWENWWLLPVQGDGPLDATYTFIGEAVTGLGNAWNPANYGPEINSSSGTIYTYGAGQAEPIYFSRHHNLFIAGKFAFQVEAALAAAKGEIDSWEDDESFQHLRRNFEKDATNRLQLIMQNSVVPSSLPAHWYETTSVQLWQSYADWLAMDFTVSDSSCLLTTYSISEQTNYLSNTDPVAWLWVPEIVESAMPIALGAEVQKSQVDKDWIGDGAWRLQLSTLEASSIGRELWVLPIGDSTVFQSFSANYLNDKQLTDQRDYQLYNLKQLQSGTGFEFLTDRQHWQPWFVELSGALVVSVFYEDLERYLDYQLVGGTITQQDFFLDMKAGLSGVSKPKHQGFLRWGPLADAETNLLNILFPGYEWSAEGGLTFVADLLPNGVIRSKAKIGQVPKRALPATIRWTLPLATDQELSLFPVKEIGPTPVNYFLVQAKSGRSWMVDLEGTILWEKPNLPAVFDPVWHWRSSSGALHWAATSAQGLHIWNQDGVAAELPVITSIPAAGLSLISFDSRGVPTLAYPNKNKELELRSPAGNLLEGWPAKLSGRSDATFPLVHWQTDTEDLIIAWTETEGWQFFGKQGQYLNSLPTVPEPMLGNPAYDFYPLSPEQSRLFAATASGKVNVWDLEGNIVPVPLGRGPLDRWFLQNAWGDDRPDYIAQRGSLVHLFGFDGDSFSERWQQRFLTPPDTLFAAGTLGTLVINKGEQKVWLIDRQGRIPAAFPLAGTGGAHLVQTESDQGVLVTLLDGEVYAYDLQLAQ